MGVTTGGNTTEHHEGKNRGRIHRHTNEAIRNRCGNKGKNTQEKLKKDT